MKSIAGLIACIVLAFAAYAEDFTEIQAPRGAHLREVVAKLYVDAKYVPDIAKLNNLPADAPIPDTIVIRVPWRYLNTAQVAKVHKPKKEKAPPVAKATVEDSASSPAATSSEPPVVTNAEAIEAEVQERMAAQKENWQAERKNLENEVNLSNAKLRTALNELAKSRKVRASVPTQPDEPGFLSQVVNWVAVAVVVVAGGLLILLFRAFRRKFKSFNWRRSFRRADDTQV